MAMKELQISDWFIVKYRYMIDRVFVIRSEVYKTINIWVD